MLRKTFIIILIAFALRLVIAFILIFSFPDSKFDSFADCKGYQLLAENIIEGHGFSGSTQPPYAPDTKRTPGFPLFLGIIYYIFGYTNAPFFIINSLIGALSCGLAYPLFKLHFSDRTAFLASIFFAIDIDSILSANFIMTETLFTFTLIAAIYFLFGFLKNKRIIYLLFSVLLFAAGAYIRPTGIILTLIVLIIIACYHRFKGSFSWKQLLLACFSFIILLLPWYIRNYSQTGRFEFSSAGQSRIFRYWTRAFVIPEARRSGIDEREQFYRLLDDNTREWMRENPDFEISADGMPISDIREYEFLRRLKPVTKEMMRGHYLQVIGAHLYGSLGAIFGTTFDRYNDAMLENKLDFGAWTGNTLQRMASGDGREALGEFFNGRHFYLQLGAAIWSLGHIFLAVIGMVILLKRRLYFPLIIFGLIIAYHLFSGGIDSPPRFRIPALPFIFIFSAVTINSIFKLKDRNYVK